MVIERALLLFCTQQIYPIRCWPGCVAYIGNASPVGEVVEKTISCGSLGQSQGYCFSNEPIVFVNRPAKTARTDLEDFSAKLAEVFVMRSID